MREGEIVVNDNPFRVSQQPAACRFGLRPASLTVAAAGETREIRVSGGSACSWTAATDASWISFTTPVRGSGDATVAFRVAPNRADDQRVGTITVGDQRSTVTQAGVAGSACTYEVSPGSQSRALERRDRHVAVRHRRERLRLDGDEQRRMDHGDGKHERHGQRDCWVQRGREHGRRSHGHDHRGEVRRSR